MDITQLRQRIEKLRKQSSQNYQSYTTPKYDCPICEDREFILEEDDKGYTIARPCKCHAQKQYQRLLKSSGMSKGYLAMTFDNYKVDDFNRANYLKAQEYIKSGAYKDIGFMIVGRVGSGKTHLANAVCNSLLTLGVNIHSIIYRDFSMQIKRNRMNEEYYSDTIEKIKNCQILYIDDLFKGNPSDSDKDIMYEIINYRYVDRQPVIITSEKSLEELIQIDEATGTRLYEMCEGYVLRSKGVNRRIG